MKPVRTWILIADGKRARVVMNDGPGHGIKSVKEMDCKAIRHSFTEPENEEPVKLHDHYGVGRHDVEPSVDFAHEDHRQFATELGQKLYEKLNARAYDRMIIFASPAMLGELRLALSPQVLDKVVEQVPKDLVRLSNKELTKHLQNVLAV